jgi:hypothetical protein
VIALRVLATIAGLGILAAVAHTTMGATGGYGWDTNAPLTIGAGGRCSHQPRPSRACAVRALPALVVRILRDFLPASSSADRVGHGVG